MDRMYVLETSTVEPNALSTMQQIVLLQDGRLFYQLRVWKEPAEGPKQVMVQSDRLLCGFYPAGAEEVLDGLLLAGGYLPISAGLAGKYAWELTDINLRPGGEQRRPKQ